MTMTPERLAEIRARSEVRDEMLFWKNKDAHHDIKDLLAEIEWLQQEAATVRRDAMEEACRTLCGQCDELFGKGGTLFPPDESCPYWTHSAHVSESGNDIPSVVCGADMVRRAFEKKGKPDAG